MHRGAFVCAADRLGIGFCWGEDSFSGSGSKAKGDKPQQVSGNLKFSSMAVGHYHACGLTPKGLLTRGEAPASWETDSQEAGRFRLR